MIEATTLETDGGYTLVLDRLTKGYDVDIGDERGVKVHLYA